MSLTAFSVEWGLRISGAELSYYADRFNLLVGVVLLNFAVYLRFITPHRVPNVYEYTYLAVGSTYFLAGFMTLTDPSVAVALLRLVRQVTVLMLGCVLFWHLVRTTNLSSPVERAVQAYRQLRNQGGSSS